MQSILHFQQKSLGFQVGLLLINFTLIFPDILRYIQQCSQADLVGNNHFYNYLYEGGFMGFNT